MSKFDSNKTFKLEKELQKYCIDYVKHLTKKGLPIMVVNVPAGPYGKRGISDLLLCIDGAFVAVELKNGDTNHPVSPSQQRFIDNVKEAGGTAEVIRSFGDFQMLVNNMLSQYWENV